MTPSSRESDPSLTKPPGGGDRLWKWSLGLGCVAAIAAVYFFFGRHLSIAALAERETELRDFQQQHWFFAYVAAFAIYVVITGLSLPGAALLTILYGWLFGLVGGVTLVSFASTLGATIAFSLSRYLFRDALQQRYQRQLEKLNASIDAEGAYYLFTLRLIPVIPFFLINLLMGLTPIRLWTFWWVSQLGMLAGTVVYVAAGASLPTLQAIQAEGLGAIVQWPTLVAFALLGLLPLAAKEVVKRLSKPHA